MHEIVNIHLSLSSNCKRFGFICAFLPLCWCLLYLSQCVYVCACAWMHTNSATSSDLTNKLLHNIYENYHGFCCFWADTQPVTCKSIMIEQSFSRKIFRQSQIIAKCHPSRILFAVICIRSSSMRTSQERSAKSSRKKLEWKKYKAKMNNVFMLN